MKRSFKQGQTHEMADAKIKEAAARAKDQPELRGGQSLEAKGRGAGEQGSGG